MLNKYYSHKIFFPFLLLFFLYFFIIPFLFYKYISSSFYFTVYVEQVCESSLFIIIFSLLLFLLFPLIFSLNFSQANNSIPLRAILVDTTNILTYNYEIFEPGAVFSPGYFDVPDACTPPGIKNEKNFFFF